MHTLGGGELPFWRCFLLMTGAHTAHKLHSPAFSQLMCGELETSWLCTNVYLWGKGVKEEHLQQKD